MDGKRPQPTEKEEPSVVFPYPYKEFIRIGELQLASETLSIKDLSELAVAVLETKSVREYLRGLDKKKMGGTYCG